VILVLNCGSSSIKFRLFHDDLTPDVGGTIDRIGETGGPASHADALTTATSRMRLEAADLTMIGHRVVHGGPSFIAPTLITDDVLAALDDLTPLAPQHNPPALAAIRAVRNLRPDLPQIAVFDTAFHADMPAAAATYAIDTAVADRYGIRRYGFHGTSHAYVARRTAQLLDRPVADINTIVLHLGNGASVCAVAGGRSVETSMGLTPLEGLVMGARSGDIDAGVLLHLSRVGGYTTADLDDLLNHRSGLQGLCGDNDMRTVEARRAAGDPAAAVAFDVYCHRLRKYIGAYTAVLGHVDAVTFTGGVGEHSSAIREAALAGLEGLGLRLDPTRNVSSTRGSRTVSMDKSPTAICVIPADEELEVATQVRALFARAESAG
jgi:acetate kinase